MTVQTTDHSALIDALVLAYGDESLRPAVAQLTAAEIEQRLADLMAARAINAEVDAAGAADDPHEPGSAA